MEGEGPKKSLNNTKYCVLKQVTSRVAGFGGSRPRPGGEENRNRPPLGKGYLLQGGGEHGRCSPSRKKGGGGDSKARKGLSIQTEKPRGKMTIPKPPPSRKGQEKKSGRGVLWRKRKAGDVDQGGKTVRGEMEGAGNRDCRKGKRSRGWRQQGSNAREKRR